MGVIIGWPHSWKSPVTTITIQIGFSTFRNEPNMARCKIAKSLQCYGSKIVLVLMDLILAAGFEPVSVKMVKSPTIVRAGFLTHLRNIALT